MKTPDFVTKDLETVSRTLDPFIEHYGIFGSLLSNDVSKVNDVDVLWVYSGITFDGIRQKLQSISLAIPFVCSYRNYGVWIPEPPKCQQYYDFIFMPRERPDREFMTIHDGRVQYFTEPFESWRSSGVVVAL